MTKKKPLKAKVKKKPETILYAYSDGDGFIHYNKVEAGALWLRTTKEWIIREKDLDRRIN